MELHHCEFTIRDCCKKIFVSVSRLNLLKIIFSGEVTGGANSTDSNSTTTDDEKEKEPNIYKCEEGEIEVHPNICYLHQYDTELKQLRGIAEVILILWSIVYLGIAVREVTFVPFNIYLQNMALCPSRVGFLLGKNYILS